MYINSNYNDVSFRSRLWITEAVGILLATGEGPRWAPTSKITRCVSTIVHGWIPIQYLIRQSPSSHNSVSSVMHSLLLTALFLVKSTVFLMNDPKKKCDMMWYVSSFKYVHYIYIYYIIFVIWWYMCWLWSLFSWWKPHGPGQLHPPQRPSQPSTCGA